MGRGIVSRRQWRQGRMCLLCGEAAGRKTVCGRCSPSRGTRPHVDKYAHPARKLRTHHRKDTTNDKTRPKETP